MVHIHPIQKFPNSDIECSIRYYQLIKTLFQPYALLTTQGLFTLPHKKKRIISVAMGENHSFNQLYNVAFMPDH